MFTGACGLTWSFWSMFATRFLAGVGAAFVSPQIWAAIPMVVPRGSVIKVEIRDQADSAVIRVRAPLEALLPAALARIGASTGFLPDHDWLPLVTHGFPPSDGEVWERLLPETPSDAQIQVLAALANNPHQ